jgi:LPS-assembly lipoprotein
MNHRSLVFGALALATGLLTTACGFQPLYGSAGFAALPGLQIDSGESRQDYLIEQALDRFLGDGRSAYRLSLETLSGETRLGVSAADRASRFALNVTTSYILTPPNAEALRGEVSETVYFDAPGDPYALIAARADAEERAADLIARALARDLSVALQRRNSQAQP